jgi:DNA repair protein RecO (recombination protein O)
MVTNERVRAPATRASAPQLAYVLHTHDWSESSLIVELFTRAQGRVVVAAKGAKRPTSQLRAVLLPFQPIQVLLGKTPADAQAEVLNLRSAEWAGGAPLLPPAAMLPGFYTNELLLKLLARHDAHKGLFDAYADTLAALATEDREAVCLRAFELLLLQELGVLPDLSVVTQTAQPLQPAGRYTLDTDSGLHLAATGGIGGTAWTGIAAALLHGAPAALRAACAPVAGALRVPLRSVLYDHLGHARLRTRQVGQDMQRLAAPPMAAGAIDPAPEPAPERAVTPR